MNRFLIFYVFFTFSYMHNVFSANKFNCHFGFLTGEGEIQPKVVVDTYLNLLNQVGEGKITPAVMQAIHDSGDPFALPQGLVLPSDTLQASLNDFKDMLKTRGKEGGIPFKDELLKSLLATKTTIVKQEDKQKTEDKKNIPLVTSFDWKLPVRSVFNHGKWYFGVAAATHGNKGGWTEHNIIRIHDGKQEIELPFTPPADCEGLVYFDYNESKNELYFSDGKSSHMWKMKIFDDSANPVKSPIIEKLLIDTSKPSDFFVANIEISRDGKYMVTNNQRNAFVTDLTDLSRPLKVKLLGKVNSGGMETHYGFIGNHKYYIESGTRIAVHDLDGIQKPLELPASRHYNGASNEDGTSFQSIKVFGVGDKPNVMIHDLANNTRPVNWDLGHRDPLESWEESYHDETFYVTGTPYYGHLYIGRKSDVSKRELRLTDPKTLQDVLKIPIKMDSKERIKELKMTTDNKAIFGTTQFEYASHDKHGTRTTVWSMEALLESIE